MSRPGSAASTDCENILIGCETSLLKTVSWIFQKNFIIIKYMFCKRDTRTNSLLYSRNRQRFVKVCHLQVFAVLWMAE